MEQRDQLQLMCCERFRSYPGYKYCPYCGKELKPLDVSQYVFKISRYYNSRLVSSVLYSGRLKDVLYYASTLSKDFKVELVQSGQAVKYVPPLPNANSVEVLEFGMGTTPQCTLAQFKSFVESEMPDFYVASLSEKSVRLRRR